MANLISTLQDGDQNKILPRTALKAIADDNGNYLDNTLVASDINTLKEGKLAEINDKLTLTTKTQLINQTYSSGSSSWVSNNYSFDTNYKVFILLCQCTGGTRNSVIFTYDEYVLGKGLIANTTTWNSDTIIMTYINDNGTLHVDTKTVNLSTSVQLWGLK